ncbi:hypothetical protein HME9302_01200 [Alteripontixanthobacter maritimus]|uniref:DUF1499 domain-containing protein n=1 Tax=Alteripontixanthobacter maritimus TaxID=2161824 RepID=A0A369Q696_9SPHN|nr:DUF1499 domain-containing protein [Alteripontixanthobacter maritimus]RDC60002.1 hypothetical protein HME9302_01200 [Alteripontixanthobacter maritimus]
MDSTAHANTRYKWTALLSRLTLALAVIATVLALGGMTLARYDLIGKLVGFSGLSFGMMAAIAALLFGIAALIMNARKGWPHRTSALLGFIIAVVFIGVVAARVLSAGSPPAIHDITTDLADPPAFSVLPLAEDNLRGLESEQEWRELHSAAYGDLDTVTIDKPVAEVIADAEALAREKGWTVALADPETGRLEATAYAAWIRFEDDVVLRVTPSADGRGSDVDMRSVSKVGVSDLGVNAQRIEDFLTDLATR